MKILRTIIFVVVVVAVLWLVLLWLPEWMVNQYGGGTLSRLDYTKAVDDYRKTLAQIVGGFALLIGLYFTWRTTRSTEDGRITDRFSKAVEQLGASNKEGKKQLEPRLGGIYALERIARDSQRDRWPIVEILCAYVRANAPRKYTPSDEETGQPAGSDPVRTPPDADVEAILKVLRNLGLEFELTASRIIDLYETELFRADLSALKLNSACLNTAYLERADLSGAQLKAADLASAWLERAKLTKANLEGANFYRAKLMDADLYGTNLSGANLSEANLTRANFKNATMGFSGNKSTNLRGANLANANLKGVDLEWVSGLTASQISKAQRDETTKLPDAVIKEMRSIARGNEGDDSGTENHRIVSED